MTLYKDILYCKQRIQSKIQEDNQHEKPSKLELLRIAPSDYCAT